MKSYNHLWETFISDDNYYLAVKNATKGKTGKSKKHRRARYYRTHAEEMKDEFMEYVLNYKHRDRDLDFMGFQFFRNRTVLRSTIYFKAVRKARRIKNRGLNIYTARQMLSYMGWFGCTDTHGAYIKHIKPYVSFRSMRRYVSRWDKKHNKEINYGLV